MWHKAYLESLLSLSDSVLAFKLACIQEKQGIISDPYYEYALEDIWRKEMLHFLQLFDHLTLVEIAVLCQTVVTSQALCYATLDSHPLTIEVNIAKQCLASCYLGSVAYCYESLPVLALACQYYHFC